MVKFEDLLERKRPIAVVGLGYVGLPLAVALSAHMDVTGFDVNPKRIAELVRGEDHIVPRLDPVDGVIQIRGLEITLHLLVFGKCDRPVRISVGSLGMGRHGHRSNQACRKQ